MRSDAESNMFAIIDLMQRPGGATIPEICDELGCDRHTFYVHKQKLEKYGVPFYDKGDYSGNTNSKRWYIDPEWSNSAPLVLEPKYRLILRMLLGRTRLFESAQNRQMLKTIRKKIEGTFLDNRKVTMQSTYCNFKGTKNYAGKEKLVEKLLDCIETRHLATVTYQAAKSPQPKTYDIEPYTLVEHGNSFYMIVAVPKHDRDIRILAVERIVDITKSETTRFKIPENFDPEQYLNPSFGIVIEEPVRVVVRFTAEAALYARERTWGLEQTVQTDADGTLTLAFTASGTEEIKRWILSFGPDARVLEPADLVERVATSLREARALYP